MRSDDASVPPAPPELEILEILDRESVKVIDGDSMNLQLRGETTYIRLRGIDAPETRSWKNRPPVDEAERMAGERATERVKELIHGRRLFVLLQPREDEVGAYLAHLRHRLLAFVRLDEPNGEDLGEILLREGLALVWKMTGKSRRYLHPKAEDYVRACNAALQTKPAGWADGWQPKCPCIQARHERWSLDECKDTCFRKDWRSMAGEVK